MREGPNYQVPEALLESAEYPRSPGASTVLESEGSDVEDVCGVPEVSTFTDVTAGSWCDKHLHSQASTVMITVDSTPCCALIDTGAQLSCISEGVVDAIGKDREDCSIRSIGGIS